VDGRLRDEVRDDGRGADPTAGSRLRGLADRGASLDGGTELISPPTRRAEPVATTPLTSPKKSPENRRVLLRRTMARLRALELRCAY
jgi:hypothetical protein